MLWVVEDDDAIAQCLQLLLEGEGYTVKVATSLDDARQLTTCPDLVILDFLLPDGNGLAFLPELAARYATVPVILLTAQERVGATRFPSHVAYLAKPFTKKELLKVVKVHLRSHLPRVLH